MTTGRRTITSSTPDAADPSPPSEASEPRRRVKAPETRAAALMDGPSDDGGRREVFSADLGRDSEAVRLPGP